MAFHIILALSSFLLLLQSSSSSSSDPTDLGKHSKDMVVWDTSAKNLADFLMKCVPRHGANACLQLDMNGYTNARQGKSQRGIDPMSAMATKRQSALLPKRDQISASTNNDDLLGLAEQKPSAFFAGFGQKGFGSNGEKQPRQLRHQDINKKTVDNSIPGVFSSKEVQELLQTTQQQQQAQMSSGRKRNKFYRQQDGNALDAFNEYQGFDLAGMQRNTAFSRDTQSIESQPLWKPKKTLAQNSEEAREKMMPDFDAAPPAAHSFRTKFDNREQKTTGDDQKMGAQKPIPFDSRKSNTKAGSYDFTPGSSSNSNNRASPMGKMSYFRQHLKPQEAFLVYPDYSSSSSGETGMNRFQKRKFTVSVIKIDPKEIMHLKSMSQGEDSNNNNDNKDMHGNTNGGPGRVQMQGMQHDKPVLPENDANEDAAEHFLEGEDYDYNDPKSGMTTEANGQNEEKVEEYSNSSSNNNNNNNNSNSNNRNDGGQMQNDDGGDNRRQNGGCKWGHYWKLRGVC